MPNTEKCQLDTNRSASSKKPQVYAFLFCLRLLCLVVFALCVLPGLYSSNYQRLTPFDPNTTSTEYEEGYLRNAFSLSLLPLADGHLIASYEHYFPSRLSLLLSLDIIVPLISTIPFRPYYKENIPYELWGAGGRIGLQYTIGREWASGFLFGVSIGGRYAICTLDDLYSKTDIDETAFTFDMTGLFGYQWRNRRIALSPYINAGMGLMVLNAAKKSPDHPTVSSSSLGIAPLNNISGTPMAGSLYLILFQSIGISVTFYFDGEK